MQRSTRSRFPDRTVATPLITLETVDFETAAAAATSEIVGCLVRVGGELTSTSVLLGGLKHAAHAIGALLLL
jgi:hypothetical protein